MPLSRRGNRRYPPKLFIARQPRAKRWIAGKRPQRFFQGFEPDAVLSRHEPQGLSRTSLHRLDQPKTDQALLPFDLADRAPRNHRHRFAFDYEVQPFLTQHQRRPAKGAKLTAKEDHPESEADQQPGHRPIASRRRALDEGSEDGAAAGEQEEADDIDAAQRARSVETPLQPVGRSHARAIAQSPSTGGARGPPSFRSPRLGRPGEPSFRGA